MPNLYKLKDNFAPKVYETQWDVQETRFRDEWLQKVMKMFYSETELEDILSARRSAYSNEAVIADFMKCEQPDHPIPKDTFYFRAVEWVYEKFKPNRTLHPVHFADLRYYPWTLNVSAEAPWNTLTYRFNLTTSLKGGEPGLRDVDWESTKVRLFEDLTANLGKVEDKVLITDYLRQKQRAGLINNSRPTFHNLYNEIMVKNRRLIHQIKEGHKNFWKPDGKPIPYQFLTLHTRSHVVEHDEPDKLRAVFGAPKLLLMVELMFIWIIQATYLNTNAGRMLWGREITKGGWRRLFQEVYQTKPRNTYISADWKGFDRRLLHELIDQVHFIWRRYFDFSEYEATNYYPEGRPADKVRIERLWTWMCHAIKRTPIRLPDGSLWMWTYNGFGSGFQQTQLMDSFSNAIMLTTCLCSLGVRIEAEGFWARFQGDDSITGFLERMIQLYGTHFLIMLSESALYYFNAVLSEKHSSISESLNGMTVLSYSNVFGLAWRDELDLVKHLYFPERPQDFGRLAASANGLARAALGIHDRFHSMCLFIWNQLVIEDKIRPNFTQLRWMVRVGMVDTLATLEESPFPTIIELQMTRWNIKQRSENEQQKQWPTIQRNPGDFVFIHSV